MEQEIQNWISEFIEIERNKRFSSNGKILELDIYIPSKNIGIEFNGLYWHSEGAGVSRKYHIDKTNWFKDNFDIQIIHIFENEWIQKQDITKSIILNKVGKSPIRVFARKCKIVELTSKEYRDFLDENHIQGAMNSKQKYALTYDNDIVAVMGFGKNRFKKGDMELHRFCCKTNMSVIGGFSRLLKHFIRNHETVAITSYCDMRYSIASGYIKNGFEIENISTPNYFYFNKEDLTLKSRVQFQKHKLKDKLEFFDSSLTEWENMQMNGWNRIWDCGNYVLKYSK